MLDKPEFKGLPPGKQFQLKKKFLENIVGKDPDYLALSADDKREIQAEFLGASSLVSFAERIQEARTTEKTKRQNAIQLTLMALNIIFLPPIALLGFGFLLRWIIRVYLWSKNSFTSQRRSIMKKWVYILVWFFAFSATSLFSSFTEAARPPQSSSAPKPWVIVDSNDELVGPVVGLRFDPGKERLFSIIDLNGEAVGVWLWRDRVEGNGDRVFFEMAGCDVTGEAYSNGLGENVLPNFSVVIAQSDIWVGDPSTNVAASYSSILLPDGTCTPSSGSFSQTHLMHFGGTWDFISPYRLERR